MTFNIVAPNAGQSPGIFPAQNNTNFDRLKTLINAEHVFNDTAAANDGVHKQMTMVARADPVSLPAGTNGILYNKVVGSNGEMFYYNGTTIIQLTPYDQVLPIRVAGSQSLAGGASVTIFNPTYNWAGTGWAILQDRFKFYNLIRNFSDVDAHLLDSNGSSSIPTLQFSGAALQAKNNSGSTQIISWSLIVNRIVN